MSELVSIVYKNNPKVFYVSFAIAIVCSFIFAYFVYKYIRSVHNIYSILGTHGSLIKTCALLASFKSSKKRNNFILKELNVIYSLGEDLYEENNRVWIPFKIKYEVVGSGDKVSEIYYKMIASPSARRAKNVSIRCEGRNHSEARKTVTEDKYYNNILTYTFNFEKPSDNTETVFYKLFLDYKEKAGIELRSLSRLLIVTDNFSSNVDKDAVLNVKIIIPDKT